jgi:dihydroneopterin aldolase
LRYASRLRSILVAFARRGRWFLANWDGVKDRIHIQQLEVPAHIGVPDEERAAPQRLTFNITLWPKHDASQLEDQIARTVNYASVCAETKKFVKARCDKLIETLASALALHLLEVFEIRRITIELRKFILPDVEFVSVTVTRDRPDK